MVADGVGNAGPSFLDGKERFESESVGEPVTAPSAAAYHVTELGFGCIPCGFSKHEKVWQLDNEGRLVWC